MTMSNLEEASPQAFIEDVMSDLGDREKTTHPTTPKSTQGSNEENLTN
jgi:hypothetical protein